MLKYILILALVLILAVLLFMIARSKNINAKKTPEMNFAENSWRFTEGVKLTDNETDPMTEGSEGLNTAPKTPKMNGIDVSVHDGKINWGLVKNQVDFAIIRCGFGQNFTKQDDQQWINNVNGCTQNQIPFGVYLYSYAKTTLAARSEARHVLRLVKGRKFRFPIYYDMEDEKTLGKLTNKRLAAIARTFCNTITGAGYEVGVYANTTWWNTKLTDAFFNNPNISKWVAQYAKTCTYKGNYDMWQYTSEGKINGINGNVDKNFWYKDVRK